MKTGVFRMYLIAAAWAIMGAIISLVIIVDHSSEPPWLSIIFDMGIAIIVLFTGRIAKRQEMSPWKTGSIAGGIYPVRRKTLLFRAGIEGARRQAKVFPCKAMPGSCRDKLTVCSLFDNRIYWRLSPAIVGSVKYIASSRPDVNRIRRTIIPRNRRPSGDRIGGFWRTLCESS